MLLTGRESSGDVLPFDDNVDGGMRMSRRVIEVTSFSAQITGGQMKPAKIPSLAMLAITGFLVGSQLMKGWLFDFAC